MSIPIYIPYTDGIEECILLRKNGKIGIYDGCHEILIDQSDWNSFVKAVNKMDKLLVLK